MRTKVAIWTAVTALGALALATASAGAVRPMSYEPVTAERLINAAQDGSDWLMYHRTYNGWNYSPLTQINRDNVKKLVPVWTLSTGKTDGHEAPPIVNNGIMFVAGPYNTLKVLDATNGDVLWSYERQLPQDVYSIVCCDVVNRGVALYGDKVYMGTLDAHLLAFDAKTGKIVWDTTVIDYKQGYSITVAPLAVNGLIIVGVSGGEYGIRGFIDAYDAETGKQIWRTYVTPAPNEPGGDTWPGETYKTGGGGTWITGHYDPELDLLYWGVGQPGPWMGDTHPGDNLYTSSVIAMDPYTGEIKHHFQFTPNDSWDYDGNTDSLLIDLEIDGKQVKALYNANRNGWAYLLDRTDLSFIRGEPFVYQNVFKGLDPKTGRPIVNEDLKPATGKMVYNVCPYLAGGRNWYTMAYNPELGLAYVPSNNWCMDIGGEEVTYEVGKRYVGAKTAGPYMAPGYDYIGELQAIDVKTGKQVWSFKTKPSFQGSPLATAGGLVFVGTVDRYFRALDAKTGEVLWQFRTNSGIHAVPSTFEVNGKQYIAVQSGIKAGEARRQQPFFPEVTENAPMGGAIWVFALSE